MFSNRLEWDLTPNELAETLVTKRAAQVEVLDLTESNPTRAGFNYDPATLAALAQPGAMHYEPDPRGLRAAREAVAEYYLPRGPRVHPDSIYLTSSTSEAYSHLLKLLADPGDEILVPRPSYPLLDFLAVLDSVRPVQYPLNYDRAAGWRIDLDRLTHSISERTAALVVVNPNNPTGSYLKSDELDKLDAICAERNLALIVDEVFSDYGYGQDASRVETVVGGSGEALTFTLSGLSKVAGLPQVKLGWIQVGGPDPICREAQTRLDVIADTYLSVSTPVQHAVPGLLAERDMIQSQIKTRIFGNYQFLQTHGTAAVRALRYEGGWYAVIETASAFPDDELVHQLLESDNVLIHPGYFYDFDSEHVLVASLLTPTAVFQTGISRLLSRLNL
jgi:hypothetical protein